MTTCYLPLGRSGGRVLVFQDCIRCRFYYPHYALDVLTGQRSPHSLTALRHRLQAISPAQRPRHPRIWHFFFELGYHYLQLPQHLQPHHLLAVEMVFARTTPLSLPPARAETLGSPIPPAFSRYQKSFARIQRHLWRGDCYQVNLTFPFHAAFQGSLLDLLAAVWRRQPGAYAHACHFPRLGQSWISQSPECLFQVKRRGEGFSLQTMPIKGSLELGAKDCLATRWLELSQDSKQRGELLMIADLLRNDLNRIAAPRAQVLKSQAPLKVPGLLHQYALLEVPLPAQVNLDQILQALFPGGSVTGVPKRRAMDIIGQVESHRRGLYCGSSFIHHGDIFQGNINIRMALANHRNGRLRYFAGGGLTLPSGSVDEYREMLAKAHSFFGGAKEFGHKTFFY